jgi:hypothetical protein
MAALSDPLPAQDELARQYQGLLREREELSRRLNDALGRLAGKDAGAWSLASPGGGPQHDQLVQVFRQLKLQDFQALSLSLYSVWQKKAAHSGTTPPTFALARFRQTLAEAILVEGSMLLSVRRSGSVEADMQEVSQAIHESIQTQLKMKNTPPPEVAGKLNETIARGIHLLREMAMATPPACLLVPHRETAFVPEQHEAMIGCPDQGTVRVKLTVFPGYLVTASNRVMEKALVYTAAMA